MKDLTQSSANRRKKKSEDSLIRDGLAEDGLALPVGMYDEDEGVGPRPGQTGRLDDARAVARPLVHDEEQHARRLLRLVFLGDELRAPLRHLLRKSQEKTRLFSDFFFVCRFSPILRRVVRPNFIGI